MISGIFATNDIVSPGDVKVSPLNLTSELETMQGKFESMSNEELNQYISDVVKKPQTRGIGTAAMQTAWLAAAQIAINKGYKCSGTLVKYSVAGVDYNEYDGIFKSKIKASAPYKSWCKKPTSSYRNITFGTGTPDLYYSLHTASIKLAAASSQTGIVRVYDLYDFDIKFMGSLFSTIVNDWAALCTYTGILHNIDVTINFHA